MTNRFIHVVDRSHSKSFSLPRPEFGAGGFSSSLVNSDRSPAGIPTPFQHFIYVPAVGVRARQTRSATSKPRPDSSECRSRGF